MLDAASVRHSLVGVATTNFLIGIMRGVLIATGITPPTPENERRVLLILFLVLLGIVVGAWLILKFLVPRVA